jgi:hypothetical protein
MPHKYRSCECCNPTLDDNNSENFVSTNFMNEEKKRYNRIILKDTKFYFLTVNNESRKAHIKDEFKEFSPVEINPVTNISRNKSGSTGFARMVDRGLRDQDRTKPFQSFILLEDDASKYRSIPSYLDIPDDADIVYLGLHDWGYGRDTPIHVVYSTHYDNDLIRVKNLLATHAVMICSATGAALMERCMMESYYLDTPWDIPITHAQPFYKVYAFKTPLIYQDNKYGGKESNTHCVAENHWFEKIPDRHINRSGVSNLMSCQNVIE